MVKMFKELLLSSFMINQSHFIGYFVSPCGDMRVLWGQKEDNSGPRQSFTEWWTYPIKGHVCEDRSTKLRAVFFWKDKIGKPLVRQTKKERRGNSSKIRHERREITTDATEIQSIIRDYYE